MDNATVTAHSYLLMVEDKSVQSVFADFRGKFNLELSCSEKTLCNKIKKTVKKI